MNSQAKLPAFLNADTIHFPEPADALSDPDGLLAIGGDLSKARLIHAYHKGIFPWFAEEEPILWWSPSLRAVLPPQDFHLSRSLKKLIKKQVFQVTVDHCFNKVMRCCAKAHAHQGTWITEEMIQAYTTLYDAGHAHSIEVWQHGRLVGGLYGVNTGTIFSGESMFQTTSNASKLAFAALAALLRRWEATLIDCQLLNSHLVTLGVSNISRDSYLQLLEHSRNNNQLDQYWPQANEMVIESLASYF
ncbi:leucyl/phenylalanyl-tRNA--protein transferase [Piscirickettsia litoralis]|uniref:Leucyl/phenylalanyl-tRNA--protein transferase n=1 Tax=Piscirickettsia litoralis TaxID=1891921 RepID=A0ABX3A7V4_9GAMM|nr:leucyl/phenylalanyl-tRNA--protein transferase [Piscirickettsia litoralis]ODN43791.1 leucyl/phenylalanyl-tRNA--protein transferase [Piscirickettsia litoralis]